MPNHSLLTLLEVVEKAEYGEEKIDEVGIKADSTQDELIRQKPPIYHIDDVTAENEAATDGIDKIHRAVEWNEDPDDASHHKRNESAK